MIEQSGDGIRSIGLRLLAFGTALAATWAVLLPSSGSPWQTVVLLAPWASTPSLVIGNAACIVGLLLTLRLASASEVSGSGMALAMGLALLALSFGGFTADVRGQLSDSLSSWAVLLPLLGSGAFFGAFLTTFPRRLQPYEWRGFVKKVIRNPPKVWSLFDDSRRRKSLRRTLKLHAHLVGLFAWLERQYPKVMALFLVVGVIPLLVADADWSMGAFLVYYLAVLFPWTMKGEVLTGRDRTKAAWVLIGVFGAIGVFLAIGIGGMIMALFRDDMSLIFGLAPIGLSVALMFLFVCLSVAVLWSGAVDTRLAVSHTSVYGVLGVIFALFFAVVENLLTNFVEMTVPGSDQGLALLLAGGFSAVLVGILHSPVQRLSDRKIAEWMPTETLADSAERRLAVVFVDLVGYTQATEADERMGLLLASSIEKAAARVAPRFGGRLVKRIGDAALLTFATVDGAVEGVRALRAEARSTAAKADIRRQVEVSASVVWGSVRENWRGDIFGRTVNLAARLEGEAEPGTVLLSDTAAKMLSLPVPHQSSAPLKIKGFTEPIRCTEVSLDHPTA